MRLAIYARTESLWCGDIELCANESATKKKQTKKGRHHLAALLKAENTPATLQH